MASSDKLASPISSAGPSEALLDHDSTLRVAKSVSLSLGTDSLLVADERPHKPDRGCCGLLSSKAETNTKNAISLYNVLDAQVNTSDLLITYAAPSKNEEVTVTSLQYAIGDEERTTVEKWVNALLERAYENSLHKKRLKVLINPFGGQGKAVSLYEKYAARVFAAAQCKVDVQTTEYRGQGTEIAEQIDINAYDAIICCSGDGLMFEVLNGLGKRPDARLALAKLAVGLLPGGSGNALTLNEFGTTTNVSVAALGIVKGVRTPLDLMSVSQKDSRVLSFLSQSFGIMADTDIGTDNIRWMGDKRFVYGYLVRLISNATFPCDIAIKVDVSDKKEMKERYAKLASREWDPSADQRRIEEAELSPALPELKYGGVSDEIPADWTVVPGENISTFFAGNMPSMGKDNQFFPAAWADDGFMDIITMDSTIPRLRTLKMMDLVPKGEFFDREDLNYVKASAYRLVPHQKEGYISIDGEEVPFEAFQTEIHQALATILTKTGAVEVPFGP
ncbi:hypothetical protein N7456_008145 [Penicillium angulare]|uniref:DAGKc domain-containing protein n=1 Tax=Penicillium angulare TaxID=116970 RepID=A0A9W9K8T8_9EURO|nr:hypothetical protein N7456_008145 [Penicillium angulare]